MSRSTVKWRRSGFTLLELAVVVSVVAVLAGTLLKRIVFYQEQAEKVAMETTVGILRSTLYLKFASLATKGEWNEIKQLANKNPIALLATPPPNYIGETFSPEKDYVVSGNWYFDHRDKNLVYLVHNTKNFRAITGKPNEIRFRVALVKGTQDPSGRADNVIEGVVLQQVSSYKWF